MRSGTRRTKNVGGELGAFRTRGRPWSLDWSQDRFLTASVLSRTWRWTRGFLDQHCNDRDGSTFGVLQKLDGPHTAPLAVVCPTPDVYSRGLVVVSNPKLLGLVSLGNGTKGKRALKKLPFTGPEKNGCGGLDHPACLGSAAG